jgi:hypothetical protein
MTSCLMRQNVSSRTPITPHNGPHEDTKEAEGGGHDPAAADGREPILGM